jgi:hypothetical protein
MEKYIKFFKKIICIVLFLIFGASPALVLAEDAGTSGLEDAFGPDSSLNQAAQKAKYQTSGEGADPMTIVESVIQVLLGMIGVIFFILMIYAGYLWLTARDNKDQVEKAQNIIKSSIIGLVVVLSAYAITYFIFNALLGSTLSTGASS